VRKPSIWRLVAAAALAALTVGSLVLVRRPASVSDVLRKLDFEYQNGGLFQFFWNTRGRQNAVTLEALRRAGLPDHARLFAQAVQIFEGEKPWLEHDWRAFDASPDVRIYAAARARSGFASLDAAWQALPQLPT